MPKCEIVICADDCTRFRNQKNSAYRILSLDASLKIRRKVSFHDTADIFSHFRDQLTPSAKMVPYISCDFGSFDSYSPDLNLVTKLASFVDAVDLLCGPALSYLHPSLTKQGILRELNKGRSVVATFPNSASASGVYVLDSLEAYFQFQNEVNERKSAIFREWVTGPTLNVQFILHSSGAVLASSNLQLVKLTRSGNYGRFAYLGNIILNAQVPLDDDARNVAEKAAHTIAIDIHRLGYRGIIGFDILVSSSGGHVVDINPRFQNSSLAQSIFNEMNGQPHIIDQLIGRNRHDILPVESQTSHEIVGLASYVLENTGPAFIVSRNSQYGDRSMVEYLLHHQHSVAQFPLDSGVGVGMPVKGTLVETGASIGRLLFPITLANFPIAKNPDTHRFVNKAILRTLQAV